MRKLFKQVMSYGLFGCLFYSSMACSTGAPVFDWVNSLQNIQQLTSMTQQYKLQFEQYQMMLESTKSLDSFTWDSANIKMTELMGAIDTLDYYKQQAGSLDSYLSKYQDQTYYSQSPCFKGGCTQEQLQAIQLRQRQASEAQKRTNDAVLKGIEKQQGSMKEEAKKLQQLQNQAQNADGQKQALQAASQLASAQTNQLMQIRGLLVAQQNAEATRASAVANKEAIQAAGDEAFRAGKFKKSSGKTW